MKKLIALTLTFVMMMTLFVGCADSNDAGSNETDPAETTGDTQPDVVVPASALEILENIWSNYGEDEKFFVMGGDYNNPVDNAPGAVDLTVTDYLNFTLLVPETENANVTDAASMMHAMMANNFTCGVFRVTDAAAFAETMHTAISNNPWICGMPESMLIAVIGGEYVLAAFGINDAMTPFQTHMAEAYADAEIVYNEAITG